MTEELKQAAQQALEALSLALSDVDWRVDSPTQPVIHKAHNRLQRALTAAQPALGVSEGVLAILDECRNALMECDRDGDYALIDRIAALAAAQAKGGGHG